MRHVRTGFRQKTPIIVVDPDAMREHCPVSEHPEGSQLRDRRPSGSGSGAFDLSLCLGAMKM
jgi:hypothetical protein